MNNYHKLVKNGKEITPSLPFNSVGELLHKYAQEFNDKEALVYEDIDSGEIRRYSYETLLQQVKRLSYLLLHIYHLQPGDAIALHLGNSPFLLFLHLAAWANGLTTVPLDLKRDTKDRKLYKITSTQAKVIAGCGDTDENWLTDKLPQVPVVLEEELTNFSKEESLPDSDLTINSLILFTSGTTAQPKGVSLTAQNIFLNADGIADWLRITRDDRFFIVLPLHHINSTTMCMATLLRGGTIVLTSRYTRTKFFQLMAEHACTLSSIVPTICLDLLGETKQFSLFREKLDQVQRIQIGSAPVVQTDVKQFISQYQIPLVQGYGSTETALRVSGINPWGITDPLYTELVEVNTIGSELKWNNLTVLSPTGEDSQEGEEGELCVRGPILTQGYLNDENSTEKAFFDGWFHTGDIGYWKRVGGEKQYFISGRAKEILIKGGVNISPLAVEDALLKHFSEIKTCFVVGVTDARFGEEVAVVIVFKPECTPTRQQEILTALKNHKKDGLPNLSGYEMPSYIFVTTEEELPKTSTGKVQRVVIRSFVDAMLHPISQTDRYEFRQLTPFDTSYLNEAVTIHNKRWGKHLGITRETIDQAAIHGIVLGAIEKNTQSLKGVLFALQVKTEEIDSLAEWLHTYDSATSALTLQTHNPLGNALLLSAIATEGEAFNERFDENIYTQMKDIAENYVSDYLPSDPVLSFHNKPKAGMTQGANVLHVLKDGRIEDKAALGFSVIMQYPILITTPLLNTRASLGTQLLEAAFLYAYDKEIKHIYAYSRPAGFYNYLKDKLST